MSAIAGECVTLTLISPAVQLLTSLLMLINTFVALAKEDCRVGVTHTSSMYHAFKQGVTDIHCTTCNTAEGCSLVPMPTVAADAYPLNV